MEQFFDIDNDFDGIADFAFLAVAFTSFSLAMIQLLFTFNSRCSAGLLRTRIKIAVMAVTPHQRGKVFQPIRHNEFTQRHETLGKTVRRVAIALLFRHTCFSERVKARRNRHQPT